MISLTIELVSVTQCYRIWKNEIDLDNKGSKEAAEEMKCYDTTEVYDKMNGIATVPLTGKNYTNNYVKNNFSSKTLH
jgi:hypothetical protein